MLFAKVLDHLRLDIAAHDERDTLETGSPCIVNRVVQQSLAGGADRGQLFGSAEA